MSTDPEPLICHQLTKLWSMNRQAAFAGLSAFSCFLRALYKLFIHSQDYSSQHVCACEKSYLRCHDLPGTKDLVLNKGWKMDEKLWGAYSAWSVYKYIQIYILAKEHVHKSHSYIYCYIDVFVKQHTVHSDNRYSLSLWALLHVYFESLGAQNLALEGNQGLQHCFFWITLF